MIICRTPFRVSFFGGGTDYPGWFQEHGGAVLASTIDKYCYITARYLPPFFEHKHRIIYSKMEKVSSIDEIDHPSVRECLRFMEIGHGVEIHHDSDIPARSGLGSSSAFTVGLLKSLFALRGRLIDKTTLFKNAIHIEQDVIRENVGCQDQIMAAHGGLKHVNFEAGGNIVVDAVTAPPERLKLLNDHLMLFYTGISRIASEIAGEQIKNIAKKSSELRTMHAMVGQALEILHGSHDIGDFGRLMHESWMIKRTLSSRVSDDTIDGMYRAAQDHGALGGKILGAGGGGFFMVFARPEHQPGVRQALSRFLHVPFKMESTGSQIIFYENHAEP